MRITYRLVTAICLAMLVVVGGFTFLQIREERTRLVRDLERRAALLGEGLKEAVDPVMGGRSTAPIERILKRFGRPNQVIAVYDQLANPIAVVPDSVGPRAVAIPEITESLAISEYLAEAFPAPAHPRLFPQDLAERARARQLMMFLRTSLFALREARPTSSVFGRPHTKPMPDKARAEAAELERVALAVIGEDATSLFGRWCIADADLALALMRLVANQDPLDHRLVNYALAQFDRKSVHRFVAHLPTSR